MPQYTPDQVAFGATEQLPTGPYHVRIASMERRVSQKGNPMIVTELEVIHPTFVQGPNGQVAAAGRRVETIYTLLNSPRLGDMINGLRRAKLDPREVQNLPEGVIFDDGEDSGGKALEPFVGKAFVMRLRCVPNVLTRDATPEEIAKGSPRQVPILDDNGQQIIAGYNLQGTWNDVIGPSNLLPSDLPQF